ncbi:MAG TPA: type IV pilin [Methanosarcinales archaeon]|nr:type IV pilin [Methanosarcinales archaeon]
MTTRTRSFRKEEEAVSPVIGVILMVAITVILAAVIGAFVFGMGGSLKKTYNVGVTATQTGSTTVDVTFQGGPDADLVSFLNVSIDGTAFYNDAAAGNGDISTTVSAYGTFGTSITTGQMITIDNAVISSGRDHVVATAEFADGSKQVVLDTYV